MAYIGNAPGSIRQGRRAVYEFTSTANQTAFSGVDDNGLTLDLLQANDNDVYLNGVRLIITDDYTISGDILTLVSGAAAGDKLIVMTQDEIANDASYSKAASDSRYINYDGDIVNGTIQMGGSGNNITFADNNKAIFGAGSDLQIFHDGSNSFINELGAGDLTIKASNNLYLMSGSSEIYAKFTADGASTLYHNNLPRLATTSSGIDVTGTVTAESISVNTGTVSSSPSAHFRRNHGAQAYQQLSGLALYWNTSNGSQDNTIVYGASTNSFLKFTHADGTAFNDRLIINSSGNVGIGTTSPSAILDVVGPSARPTSLAEFDTGSTARFRSDASNADSLYIAENASGTSIQANDGAVNSTTAKPLALQPFGGNVGIGTQAAAPATKLEVAGTTKAEQYLLDAVAKDISDTAVDVFVYDTRKDSDGGAWRKRTQHTSWYNETLNTATRGSRKEFPAVAVIVAETSQITIYDGDDPDMPMWMVFNDASNYFLNQPTVSAVTMLNGKLAVTGTASNNTSLAIGDFVSEFCQIIRSNYDGDATGLVNRNQSFWSSDKGNTRIIANVVNDVAMTVLPNAPIDAATGLPVPTIAVATNGGVSIIKDDGTVVDVNDNLGGARPVAQVIIRGNDVTTWNVNNGTVQQFFDALTLSSDSTNDCKYNYTYGGGGGSTENITAILRETLSGSTYLENGKTYRDLHLANLDGLTKIHDGFDREFSTNTFSIFDSAVAYTTSSYNTGWMHGDIKLATLSDTDTTNVTGTNLVTNGDFTSNITGWNAAYNAALSHDSGKLKVTRGSTALYGTTQSIGGLTAGRRYLLFATINSTATTPDTRLQVSGVGLIDATAQNTTSNADVFLFQYFTATSSNHIIEVLEYGSDSTSEFFTVDDIGWVELEEDRSVNGNGLQVFGTVPKTPVATGADLVAYGPFTSSNYLEQPYNSDLDFGTGDFMYSMWFYRNSLPTSSYERWFGTSSTSTDERIDIFSNANTDNIAFYSRDNNVVNGDVRITGIGINVWHCIHCTRQGNIYKIYHNGELKGTNVGSSTLANYQGASGNRRTHIGASEHWDSGRAVLDGKIALAKISGTVPSPEQIKKMYEDEKVLFQENAKATLYGSSDAVTALAYDDDTELLHVGTSAGRSVFQGLRRIDNTTDAVGAAISASNGMVAED